MFLVLLLFLSARRAPGRYLTVLISKRLPAEDVEVKELDLLPDPKKLAVDLRR